MKIKIVLIAVSVLCILSACAPNENNQDDLFPSAQQQPVAPTPVDPNAASPSLDVIGDQIQTLSDGTKYLVHPSDILSGGPPKDGIPSIDSPKFTSVSEADEWLEDDNLLLGLNLNGVQKAYPLRILNWHEIVNDFAGDTPVLVTYCPLCRTGIAFDPTLDGERVEFGTSGKLFNSELVMYDRKTDSYWTQSLGKAIVGEKSGEVLEKIPLDTVQWKDWKQTFPDSQILSQQTGFFRDYDRNPYAGYEQQARTLFPLENTDTRLFSKDIVFGVAINDQAKAYAESDIQQVKVVNDEVGGVPIVVILDPQLNTVRIYERTYQDTAKEFTHANGVFTDENGEVWQATDFSDRLEFVDTFGHFWFSWASFYPSTDLYEQ